MQAAGMVLVAALAGFEGNHVYIRMVTIGLVLCGIAVARVKRRGDGAWAPLAEACPDALHVVAVQQTVSVNNGQYALSKMHELARAWIRVEWRQQPPAEEDVP